MTHMKVNFAMEDGNDRKKGGTVLALAARFPHIDAETHCVQKTR